MRRLAARGLPVVLLVLFLGSGCASEKPGYEPVNLAFSPGNPLPLSFRPLVYSRHVKDDYTDSSGFTRQVFSWGSHGGTWEMYPLLKVGYAGFFFKQPCDMSGPHRRMVMSFRFKPWQREDDIRLGLMDKNGILAEVKLKPYRLRSWRGWGLYAIPLTEVPDRGVATQEPSVAPKEIDWSAIAGLRLTSIATKPWDDFCRLRDLRFGAPLWGVPDRK